MFVLLIFIQFFPIPYWTPVGLLSFDVQQCSHIPHCWSERGPCHFLRFLIFIATVISTRVTIYAQGAGWCRSGISPDPFDTGRLTSTDAQWIVRCCCFRQQQPTEDDGASPLFFPFLLFYFLSTRHNTQSTTVSKSHECPPFINCCLCTGVCIHPLYWHGVFSLSFIPSANVFKERSGHNEKLPDKWLRVRLHGSNATTAGQKQPSSIITRDSLFILLCLTFYSV